MSCAICEDRKEKRFCPAVHGKICPQCCGEQREITIDCPSDCPYLQQAREHAMSHAHGARTSPADKATFADIEIPEIAISEQFIYEREELIVGLSFGLAKAARADRAIMDRDLLAAVSSLAKSYQTLVNSNLIYDQPTANVTHQNVAREVGVMVQEFREAEQRHIGHARLKDADVLKVLVFLLRLGMGRTSGRPKSRAFIDFLLAGFPEKPSLISGPEVVGAETGSRIVIP